MHRTSPDQSSGGRKDCETLFFVQFVKEVKANTFVLALCLVLLGCPCHALLELSKGCGKTHRREARILGGEEALSGQYPWQVALLHKRSEHLRVFCGGSLISENFVLTAAHCVQQETPHSMVARLGEHDLANDSEDRPYDDYGILRIITHENFDSERSGLANDIALLELAETVVFKKLVQPICLPKTGANFTGAKAVVSGWGRIDRGSRVSSTLKKIDVRVVDGDSCLEWLMTQRQHVLQGRFICAGFMENGHGPCKGDSGGPMIFEQNGRTQIIGIVSGSFGCGEPNSPVIYTEVSGYVDWITKKINETGKFNEIEIVNNSTENRHQTRIDRTGLGDSASCVMLVLAITVVILISLLLSNFFSLEGFESMPGYFIRFHNSSVRFSHTFYRVPSLEEI